MEIYFEITDIENGLLLIYNDINNVYKKKYFSNKETLLKFLQEKLDAMYKM